MTSRERFLTILLLILLVVVGGGGLFYLMIWRPLSDLQVRISRTREEILTRATAVLQEEQKIHAIIGRSPRLEHWKELSLPETASKSELEVKKHQDHLQVEYERYLADLLRRSGIDLSGITITSKGYDSKSSPRLTGKQPLYSRLTFTVQGPASLASVVAFLERFHTTRLLHQVRSLSLQKPQTTRQGGSRTDLDLLMTIEVLQVSGAQTRTGVMPDSAGPNLVVLASGERDYRDILSRNMFTGIPEKQAERKEDPRDVLGAVKLDHIEFTGRRWEARFYDQAKGGDEKMVNSSTLSELVVKDRYDSEVLTGEVVHISDTQGIYLLKEGKYYHLRLGDFLADMLDRPLRVIHEGEHSIVFVDRDGYHELVLRESRKPTPPRLLVNVHLLGGAASLTAGVVEPPKPGGGLPFRPPPGFPEEIFPPGG